MLLNQTECFIDFAPREARLLGNLNGGIKPKLCFATLTLNMHMHSRFFSREEVETKATFTKNCWTHCGNDTRNALGSRAAAIPSRSPWQHEDIRTYWAARKRGGDVTPDSEVGGSGGLRLLGIVAGQGVESRCPPCTLALALDSKSYLKNVRDDALLPKRQSEDPPIPSA